MAGSVGEDHARLLTGFIAASRLLKCARHAIARSLEAGLGHQCGPVGFEQTLGFDLGIRRPNLPGQNNAIGRRQGFDGDPRVGLLGEESIKDRV